MTDPMLSLAGLSPLAGKAAVARFDGGLLSPDGGVLALREVEQRLRVAERLAACMTDPRASAQITHSLADIIRFRLIARVEVGAEGPDTRFVVTNLSKPNPRALRGCLLPARSGRKPHQVLKDASGVGSHLLHEGHGQSASAVPARRRLLADVGPARLDAETIDVARRPVRYAAPAPHQDRRPRRRDEDDDPSALADLLPRAGYPALRSRTHTAPRHLTGGARAPQIFTIVPSTANPPRPKL